MGQGHFMKRIHLMLYNKIYKWSILKFKQKHVMYDNKKTCRGV